MPSAFFKNRRVYLLTAVAYMGSFLFGTTLIQRFNLYAPDIRILIM
jgi:hypothetical protein